MMRVHAMRKMVSWMVAGVVLSTSAACFDDPGTFDPDADPNFRTGVVGTECANDDRCRSGLVCVEGACAFAGDTTEGQSCSLSGECGEGLYCELTTSQCTAAGTLGVDQACSGDADCQKGLRCTPEGFSAVCKTEGDKPLGAQCEASSECLSGASCAPDPLGEGPPKCATGAAALPLPYAGVDCSESTADSGPFRMYFEVPDGEVKEFYRLPYPNDIRTDTQGRPVLTGHGTPGSGVLGFDIVQTYIDAIQADQKGFGTNTAIYLRSSAQVDFGTLNLGEDATLYMVNIDPSSPNYGNRLGLSFSAVGGAGSAGRYICQNSIALRPPWGRPLQRNTTYAVVATTGIQRAESGEAVQQDADFTSMFAAEKPNGVVGEAWDKYAPLRDWVADQAIDSSSIAVAAVFTTGDPWRRTAKTREVMRAEDITASELTLCGEEVISPCDDGLKGEARQRGCGLPDAAFDEIHGKISMPIIQRGEAPYLTEGGDVTENPEVQRSEDVCMSMMVPKELDMPDEGWPILIYAHGTGGEFAGHRNVARQIMNVDVGGQQVGMLVIGWDQVQHFTRRGASTKDPEPLVFNYQNPAGAKGNFIQGAADIHAIVKFAEELSIPAETSPTGEEIRANPNEIYFFGHSQGGTTGPVALPFEPAIKGAVLSGAGAGLTLALLGKTSPVDSPSALKLVLQDPDVGQNHPVLSLIQGYFEEVDTMNYAEYLGARAVDGVTTPSHIFHTYGLGDTFTPPSGMRALAIGMRASYLNPQLEDLETQSVRFADGPISANQVPAGDSITVAGRQYTSDGEYDGHFVAFREDSAIADWVEFLTTAIVQGVPTVGTP